MASMDDVYGGNTLKAEDLPPTFRGVVVIESATVHEFEDRDNKGSVERKILLRFKGKTKGLALNVTNANMVAEIAGSRDFDFWPGHAVLMYRTTTPFGGKMVPAIRLDHPPSNGQPVQKRIAPPPPPPPPPAREPGEDFQATDEDVPF